MSESVCDGLRLFYEERLHKKENCWNVHFNDTFVWLTNGAEVIKMGDMNSYNDHITQSVSCLTMRMIHRCKNYVKFTSLKGIKTNVSWQDYILFALFPQLKNYCVCVDGKRKADDIENSRETDKEGHRTTETPLDDSEHLPRDKKPSKRRQNGESISVLSDGTMDGTDFDGLAEILRQQSMKIPVYEGDEQIGWTVGGKKGTRAYNFREYAKHFSLLEEYLKLTENVYFLTVTAPSGYDENGKEMTAREFYRKSMRSLKMMSRHGFGRYMVCFQPQENGKPHLHAMFFDLKKWDDELLWKKFERCFSWSGSRDFQEIERGTEKRVFDYMHAYTRFSSEDWFESGDTKGTDVEKKIKKSLHCVAWAEMNGIPSFESSGRKGLEKEEILEVETQKEHETEEEIEEDWLSEEEVKVIEDWEKGGYNGLTPEVVEVVRHEMELCNPIEWKKMGKKFWEMPLDEDILEKAINSGSPMAEALVKLRLKLNEN